VEVHGNTQDRTAKERNSKARGRSGVVGRRCSPPHQLGVWGSAVSFLATWRFRIIKWTRNPQGIGAYERILSRNKRPVSKEIKKRRYCHCGEKRLKRLAAGLLAILIPRLQDTTSCQTGCQTGLYNRFDNQLYRVNGT